MNESYPIIEYILTLINEDLGLSYLFKAIRAYDTKNLPVPLEMTYFTVSCEQNRNTFFENDENQPCVKNTITIRLNCFAPLRRIPYMSHGICEIVVKFISDHFMSVIKSATIGETQYDSEVKAFMVPCTIVLDVLSCPGENSQYEELADASVYFCKSHIYDNDIHLSESDRSFLNSPYVIGEYTGDGSDGFMNILLDFKPTMVIVYRNAYHPTICDYEANITRCYFGIAIGSTYSKALTTTATGFRVRNTINPGTGTFLNESDASYTYIAFR